jgi:hypothetical protein
VPAGAACRRKWRSGARELRSGSARVRAGSSRSGARARGQARAAAALERTVVQLGLRTQAQRATGAGLPHLEAGCTQVDVVAGDSEGKKLLLLCAAPCALLGCSGKLVKQEGRGELLGCC